MHVLLTSTLVEGESSASCAGCFTPGERYGELKILGLTGTRTPTPRSSSPQPVAIPTALPWLSNMECHA
jgi:hypothetical protein